MITQCYLGSPEEADQYWMERSLDQARRGVGATSPNPPVGAAIVRDGSLIGTGYHHRAGFPHAEVEAIRSVANADSLRGATLYVTLEPCSTEGRTPACTQAILDAGLSRVVFASIDPNPVHAGRATSILREAGVDVVAGVCSEAGDHLIRIFSHWITRGRPYGIAKAGLSLDGRLVRPPGESQWLTSTASRDAAQLLRCEVDAVLVGGETVRQDRPHLTLRHSRIPPDKPMPWRVVLSASGDLPMDAALFQDAYADRTLVFSTIDFEDLWQALAEKGITSVLIEGGGLILTQAVAARCVQECHLCLAPLIVGGSKTAFGRNPGALPWELKETTYKPIGDDLWISGYLRNDG